MDIHEEFAQDLLNLGGTWQKAGSTQEKFLIAVAAFLRSLQWLADAAPAATGEKAAAYQATVQHDLYTAQTTPNVPETPSPLAPSTIARSNLATSLGQENAAAHGDRPMTGDECFAAFMGEVDVEVTPRQGRLAELRLRVQHGIKELLEGEPEEGLLAPRTYAAFKKLVEAEIAALGSKKPREDMTGDERFAAMTERVKVENAIYDSLSWYQQQQIDITRGDEAFRHRERGVLDQHLGHGSAGPSLG